MATTRPTHTCHGAIFCGAPRAAAEAACPACTYDPFANPGDPLGRLRATAAREKAARA